MAIDILKLKIGDVFFNKEKTHIAVVIGMTHKKIQYKWIKTEAFFTEDGGIGYRDVECNVPFKDAFIYAKYWHYVSSLERELI